MRRSLSLAAIVLSLVGSLGHAAGVISLPQTGQTKCYNAAGTEMNCTGTGQDGEIRAGVPWSEPRFTPSTGTEAGCVVDNLTGLMWPKNGNLPDGPLSWNGAIDYASNLTLCGYSDWRLPSINELESLVNSDKPMLAMWLNSEGFANVRSLNYWSSTTHAYYTDEAWIIKDDWGADWGGFVREISKGSDACVLPVRATTGPPAALWNTGQTAIYRSGDDGDLKEGTTWQAPRFSDSGVGTVRDNLTGLMWTKDGDTPGPAACSPGITKTWQGALDYVECLNSNTYLGYTDWRLPNRKELMSLIDRSKRNSALAAGHPFVNVISAFFWSSTTFATYTSHAWFVSMSDGLIWTGVKQADHLQIWPVRTGGPILLVSKLGTGSVTSSPEGVECGSICTVSFTEDAQVTLTATPASGYSFTNWAGCEAVDGDQCAVTMTADKNVTATFTALAYTLTVSKSGSGGIVGIPFGIDCGIDCSEAYAPSTSVTLTATPAAGYTLSGWTGCNATVGNQCTVTMTTDRTVVASFTDTTSLVTFSASGTGLEQLGTMFADSFTRPASIVTAADFWDFCSGSQCNGYDNPGVQPMSSLFGSGCSLKQDGCFITGVTTNQFPIDLLMHMSPPVPATNNIGGYVFNITGDTQFLSNYAKDRMAGIQLRTWFDYGGQLELSNVFLPVNAPYGYKASSETLIEVLSYDSTTWTTLGLYQGSFSGRLSVGGRVGITNRIVFEPICTYEITSPKPVKYKGQTLSLRVTASDVACADPPVVIDSDWGVTEGASVPVSSGMGMVKLVIPPNETGVKRDAMVMIGAEAVAVQQLGAPCKLSAFDPKKSALIAASGGSGSFSFLLPEGCGWTAQPDAKSAWLAIDTASGDGPGIITYTAGANTATGKPRSGKISVTVAGKAKSYSVKQAK